MGHTLDFILFFPNQCFYGKLNAILIRTELKNILLELLSCLVFRNFYESHRLPQVQFKFMKLPSK